MISKCANPGCSARFLYLHNGKLFRFEREPKEDSELLMGFDPLVHKHSTGVEFYWLCESCAREITLVYQKGSGVTTRPVATFKAAS